MVLGLVLVDQPGLPQPLDQLPKEDDQGHDGGGGDQSDTWFHLDGDWRCDIGVRLIANKFKIFERKRE